ncbi:MAG: sigma-70 family RNA polymerase sigma factor [Planctomycetes bacterium]|nr:sigma-70 family RNA polymerase sigma factor [Planctomycetota bacterium]
MTQDDGKLDRAALTVQWLSVLPALSTYLAAIVPDVHQANELLQTVALAVVEHLDRYDPQRPFKAWVLGIARNKVLEWRRTTATHPRLFSAAAMDQLDQACERLGDELDHRLIALRQCVEQLPANQRQVIAMRYQDDLKPRHIAQQRDADPRTIAMMLSRIRAALRKCIEQRLERAS